MLVDAGEEVEFKIVTDVGNNFFNGIEVIFPVSFTDVTDIGSLPLGSLSVEGSSIDSTIEDFVIPRLDGIEFEGNSNFLMFWETGHSHSGGSSSSEFSFTSHHFFAITTA